MRFLMVVVVIATSAISLSQSHPLPQHLTEEEFLSAPIQEQDLQSIDIYSGYANIRRQGRNFAHGQKFKFSKPLTVRNPFEFAASAARSLDSGFNEKAAPVFNLDDMLRAEAAKLSKQIEEVSLKAAKAAEKAMKTMNAIADQAGDKDLHVNVEKLVEAAVDSGLDEASIHLISETTTETISAKSEDQTHSPLETKVQPEEEEEEEVEDKEGGDGKGEEEEEEDEVAMEQAATAKLVPDEEDKQTTESAHPPNDIDLGSVQEV